MRAMSTPPSIETILADESLRRREFPVAAETVFWAHAGVCALPRCVVDAMSRYLNACTEGDQEAVLDDHFVLQTRTLASQLLCCTPQEIALIGPTSVALSLVANGVDWQPGDNVIFYQDDYPANVYPWQALEARGVELRRVKPQQLGHIELEHITPLVDERTRLVALASVHFLTGWRLHVDAIGRWLRERGVLFCLDAIQSFGALRTSVAHVDFAAADSHKWLLGPLATGVFYVRREVQERLRPTLVGWNNVASPAFITQDTMRFPSHAGRYEAGTANLAGIVGLNAALQLLLGIGIESIEARLLAFGEKIITAMEERGFEYVGPRERSRRSGILSFTRSGGDLTKLHARLGEQGIVTSLRVTRDGTRLLRFSPHFYNTEAELERVTNDL
jgi:selenocysteine lyase/cysteine desulfurase